MFLVHLLDDDLENGQITGTVSFSLNPVFCNSVEEILANCSEPPSVSCDNIDIFSENNQLIISGITTPNAIVKIYSQSWQLVFDCNADCDETIILENLLAGKIYRTDVEFYDANWQFICSDKQDITINQPDLCSDLICLGDINIRTQADLDAFCGCEVIEGSLLIQPITTSVNDVVSPPAEIWDISSLSNLKKVKGSLVINHTLSKDLQPLSQLTEVGKDLSLALHDDLESLNGLENLKSIGRTLLIGKVPKLKNLDDLSGLTSIGDLFLGDSGFENIELLGQLENTSLGLLQITNCHNLKSLEGLNKIETLTREVSLHIGSNDKLENIDALSNLKMVNGRFSLGFNPQLSNCCAILPLIDEDPTNRQINGNIIINENASFCNSIEEILDNCQNTGFSCENIDITYENNELTIKGLTAPIAIVKVFDKDWHQLFDCFADCEETITLPNVTSDIFRIQIASYDEDWKFLCHGDQDFVPAGSRNRNFTAADFTLSPNPAQSQVFIDLKRLKGEKVTLQLQNQFGQIVRTQQVEKVTDLPEKMDVSIIPNGLYFLQIQVKGRRTMGKKILVSRLY